MPCAHFDPLIYFPSSISMRPSSRIRFGGIRWKRSASFRIFLSIAFLRISALVSSSFSPALLEGFRNLPIPPFGPLGFLRYGPPMVCSPEFHPTLYITCEIVLEQHCLNMENDIYLILCGIWGWK